MKILAKSIAASAAALLRVFQVYPPVFTPTAPSQVALTNGEGGASLSAAPAHSSCVFTQTIMNYSFANSYGQPFVGTFSPPTCSFNRVTLNFTVTSAGRQFDRLAVAYLGDIEIWRTSTAEPTQTGIIWTYIKDVSEYLSLFRETQKLIFDLGNIVDSTYTGPFNTTLQATYFTAPDTIVPADLILPVSARQGANNGASAWQIPAQTASNTLTLPRNIKRAVFTLSATGQIDEEFWYTNVLSSEVDTFGQGNLLGYSPFREVQLFIDGNLAGVAWPFPIIFTGGIVPGFWRPIVGIDAFDLREDEVDITPWLPLLCDGHSHAFEIRVAGINDDGNGHGTITETVGSYWVVTGKVFIWSDPVGSITTGTQPKLNTPAPNIALSSSIGTTGNGTNETLSWEVSVTRQLSISSTVKTASGSHKAYWKQNLAYSNQDFLGNFGVSQVTVQDSNGTSTSSSGYSRTFDYPIFVNSTLVQTNNSLSITAVLNRGQELETYGSPVFPTGLQSFEAYPGAASYPTFQGSHLSTTQNGSASYFSSPNSSYSFGSTQQDMAFYGVQAQQRAGASIELYRRHVLATNGSVVDDEESLIGRSVGGFRGPLPLTYNTWAARTPRGMLGRRPAGGAHGGK